MTTVVTVAPKSSDILPISALVFDTDVQCREALRSETVSEYREAAQGGATFPPLVVFYDGKDYWVADGFHRGQAFREAGLEKAPVDIRPGTKRDAILYAVGANASHGLRRTPEDKRRAVLTLLKDSEWSGWANREIARRCAVAEGTVRNIKQELSAQITQMEPAVPSEEIPQIAEPRKAIRNGKEYTIDTSNIGKKPIEKVEAKGPPQSERRSVGLVAIADGEEDETEGAREDWEDDPDLADARDDLKLGDVCRDFKRTLLDCWARCPDSKRERFKRIVISETGELK